MSLLPYTLRGYCHMKCRAPYRMTMAGTPVETLLAWGKPEVFTLTFDFIQHLHDDNFLKPGESDGWRHGCIVLELEIDN